VAKGKGKGKGKELDQTSEELRASILKIARKHFALHGFQGASLKKIAGEAGVAGSLLNYHFTDKNGLFKQCIERFAQARMEALGRLLAEPKTTDELRVRMELFVDEMIRSVIDDPHGFEIVQQEIKSGNPMIFEIFKNTMLKGFTGVVQFFTQAQKNGLIRADLDPMILASILFSSSCDTPRKDALSQTFFKVSLTQTEWRQKFSRHIVTVMLNGVLK
jgi:TetR/AcrR family transcriptional regulator